MNTRVHAYLNVYKHQAYTCLNVKETPESVWLPQRAGNANTCPYLDTLVMSKSVHICIYLDSFVMSKSVSAYLDALVMSKSVCVYIMPL